MNGLKHYFKNMKKELLDEIYHKLIVISFDIDERVEHEILKKNIVEVLEIIEGHREKGNMVVNNPHDIDYALDRITLEVSVPNTKPDPNWRGWDLETFHLREHLVKLIQAYGIGVLREEINECEWILNQNKDG
jgi:hypothetical protein